LNEAERQKTIPLTSESPWIIVETMKTRISETRVPASGDLHQKLLSRKIRRPPLVPYLGLGYLWKMLFEKKLNVHYSYKVDLRDYRKGPYIVVSNHASRLDYIYTGCAFLPYRLN
jgi:hypothetical protein